MKSGEILSLTRLTYVGAVAVGVETGLLQMPFAYTIGEAMALFIGANYLHGKNIDQDMDKKL